MTRDPSSPPDTRPEIEPLTDDAAAARRAVELARTPVIAWCEALGCGQYMEVRPGAEVPPVCRRHDALGRWWG